MYPCILTLFFKSASLYFYPIFQKCILVFLSYFSKVHPCIFPIFFKNASLYFYPIFQLYILVFSPYFSNPSIFQKCILVFSPYFFKSASLYFPLFFMFCPSFSDVHPCIFPLFFKSASLYFPPIFQKCIHVFPPYFSKVHP